MNRLKKKEIILQCSDLSDNSLFSQNDFNYQNVAKQYRKIIIINRCVSIINSKEKVSFFFSFTAIIHKSEMYYFQSHNVQLHQCGSPKWELPEKYLKNNFIYNDFGYVIHRKKHQRVAKVFGAYISLYISNITIFQNIIPKSIFVRF